MRCSEKIEHWSWEGPGKTPGAFFLPRPARRRHYRSMLTCRSAAAVLVLAFAVAPALPAQADSTWRDHDRATDAAMARGDWSAARRHALAMDALLGGHPVVVVALARIALRLGDTTDALFQLRRIAAMGVLAGGLSDSVFDGVRPLPAFQRMFVAIAANGRAMGSARAAATIPDTAAIAEDLAWDGARQRFIVSEVHGCRLLAVGLDGRTEPFGAPLPPGWGVLGVGADSARGAVWATAVTLPQAAGYTKADSGRAAILRLDLGTGALRRRFDLPAPSRAAPGDLAIAENGDVFIGDGQTGAVYVIRAEDDTLATLVPAGRMRGTQQPAMAPDGRTLFIADYGRGLARVDRTSGSIVWLDHGPGVTLSGIDGLLMDGAGLIAVQNGVSPARIVRLTLDAALNTVTRAGIVLRDPALAAEPTHVVRVGGTLYAIGNAGWGKYGDDGRSLANGRHLAPRILRIALPPEAAPR